MTQVDPVVISGAAPVDISHGLKAGEYLAQNRARRSADFEVLYMTAASAPADDHGYLSAGPGESFRFSAGPDCRPTWVRVSDATLGLVPDLSIPVALVRLQ